MADFERFPCAGGCGATIGAKEPGPVVLRTNEETGEPETLRYCWDCDPKERFDLLAPLPCPNGLCAGSLKEGECVVCGLEWRARIEANPTCLHPRYAEMLTVRRQEAADPADATRGEGGTE